jgi:hypothetical protein
MTQVTKNNIVELSAADLNVVTGGGSASVHSENGNYTANIDGKEFKGKGNFSYTSPDGSTSVSSFSSTS